MKSKPIVRNHLYEVHTSFVVDFEFTNNITILTGASGTGKSLVFSIIRESMMINSDVVCLSYQERLIGIGKIITEQSGKLIVIDNADIALDEDTRRYIAVDGKNQYLIIGRDPSNLFTTSDNIFELISEREEEQTVFKIEPCFKHCYY